VFTATATNIFLTDASSAAANNTISVTVGSLGFHIHQLQRVDSELRDDNLTSSGNAVTALADINTAIANVAGIRGTIGAGINRLQSAVNVINSQVQNLTAAQDQNYCCEYPAAGHQPVRIQHPEPVRYRGTGPGELGAAKHPQAAAIKMAAS